LVIVEGSYRWQEDVSGMMAQIKAIQWQFWD
jgi:hypothetical protein